jgi:hypothetical protein
MKPLSLFVAAIAPVLFAAAPTLVASESGRSVPPSAEGQPRSGSTSNSRPQPSAAAPRPAVDEAGDESDAGGGAGRPPASETDPFTRADADRDGRISADEYASSDTSAAQRVADGKRRGTRGPDGGFSLGNNEGHPERTKAFRRIDTDGDGYLSRGELEQSVRSSPNPSKP